MVLTEFLVDELCGGGLVTKHTVYIIVRELAKERADICGSTRISTFCNL